MSVEKCTIPAAAKALGVSQKTIYRYLNNGTLSRIREGKNTYILIDEVRTLRTDMSVTQKEPVRTKHTDTDTDKITLSLKEYTTLVDELGQYKGQVSGQARYLLEYKASIDGKDRVILEQQAENERLRAELKRARCPWWKRLFRRGL